MGDLRVVLASASPRRRELLRAIFPRFAVRAADVDEEGLLRPPLSEGVQALARAKAECVAALDPGALVIGADTIVTLGDCAMGKPKDAADARQMLRTLSGRRHSVLTGVAVVWQGRALTACEETFVTFAPLSADLIDAYVATGEPLDKAGAYGIQGRASVCIEKIDGCYFNVVGLPLFRLGQLLQEAGIEPWRLWDSSTCQD